MKHLIFLSFLSLVLLSCKKEKTYVPFSEKELVFVNYSQGQQLKFIDTASSVHTLIQNNFRREFYELIGITGAKGTFVEKYEVSYVPQNAGDLSLFISQDAMMPSLNITFASYQAYAVPDSLSPTFSAVTVNGREYTEVYRLTMYKNGLYINNTDTAVLFHNKQFGVIQLQFPGGKKIMRTD